ncbi:hypothetical protein M407DRAFT_246979 [Tulasnella calospora MUT 4182]|uniref:Uncharacterized protein n=1 Tax=Tulasnella calospora MUT 4182 TaxID=1051891 RepID=A0A0C3Q1J2_9AGAM|nr:hypothetical protein M407DRAFT_246979 [Tulasnella calospora MUT 4182]
MIVGLLGNPAFKNDPRLYVVGGFCRDWTFAFRWPSIPTPCLYWSALSSEGTPSPAESLVTHPVFGFVIIRSTDFISDRPFYAYHDR